MRISKIILKPEHLLTSLILISTLACSSTTSIFIKMYCLISKWWALTCDVDFIVVGVLGDRGPWDELGELAIELISSSLMAWCGVMGVEATAIHIYTHTHTQRRRQLKYNSICGHLEYNWHGIEQGDSMLTQHSHLISWVKQARWVANYYQSVLHLIIMGFLQGCCPLLTRFYAKLFCVSTCVLCVCVHEFGVCWGGGGEGGEEKIGKKRERERGRGRAFQSPVDENILDDIVSSSSRSSYINSFSAKSGSWFDST